MKTGSTASRPQPRFSHLTFVEDTNGKLEHWKINHKSIQETRNRPEMWKWFSILFCHIFQFNGTIVLFILILSAYFWFCCSVAAMATTIPNKMPGRCIQLQNTNESADLFDGHCICGCGTIFPIKLKFELYMHALLN